MISLFRSCMRSQFRIFSKLLFLDNNLPVSLAAIAFLNDKLVFWWPGVQRHVNSKYCQKVSQKAVPIFQEILLTRSSEVFCSKKRPKQPHWLISESNGFMFFITVLGMNYISCNLFRTPEARVICAERVSKYFLKNSKWKWLFLPGVWLV